MLILRPLPPQFLLPAWSAFQLRQLRRASEFASPVPPANPSSTSNKNLESRSQNNVPSPLIKRYKSSGDSVAFSSASSERGSARVKAQKAHEARKPKIAKNSIPQPEGHTPRSVAQASAPWPRRVSSKASAGTQLPLGTNLLDSKLVPMIKSKVAKREDKDEREWKNIWFGEDQEEEDKSIGRSITRTSYCFSNDKRLDLFHRKRVMLKEHASQDKIYSTKPASGKRSSVQHDRKDSNFTKVEEPSGNAPNFVSSKTLRSSAESEPSLPFKQQVWNERRLESLKSSLGNASHTSSTASRWMSSQKKFPSSTEFRSLRPRHEQRAGSSQVPLIDELFPEEAKKRQNSTSSVKRFEADIPPLKLPIIDPIQDAIVSKTDQHQGKLMAKRTVSRAFREQSVATLVLSNASNSLTDADFRRIIPRGKHIDEWQSTSDILKVIPSRDSQTLAPMNHYFLVFPNAAQAQTYQSHAYRLHAMTQARAPTSLEPDMLLLPPRKASTLSTEDIAAQAAQFTLCPPQQNLTLKLLKKPYTNKVNHILYHKGYKTITVAEKSTRSVLFWVSGFQPTLLSVHTFLAKDGLDRGMQWGAVGPAGSVEALDPGLEAPARVGEPEDEKTGTAFVGRRKGFARYVLAFGDEAEARRFVRWWHRRPYSFPLPNESAQWGEPVPLVHAEVLW